MIVFLKKTIRSLQYRAALLLKRRTAKSYKLAISLGLFNYEWYVAHCGSFPHPLRAFEDYLAKSCFSNVNPSANFDTEFYMRTNVDIYHLGISPLVHYMYHGRFEGRQASPAQLRWSPVDELIPQDTANWQSQKIAICLHIYYVDFIEKFQDCLQRFPCEVDVFVAAGSLKIENKAKAAFAKLDNVNKVVTALAPNRGRNFGPLLVEFSEKLLDYDLMCHVHSKKSLYSGRQQTQWFDYLNQYLFKDKHVVKSILRLFDGNKTLGMYYPTTFWMMPSWVNHWTCNKTVAGDFVDNWGIDITENFVNYPVGGMFWARPEAIRPLLEQKFSYDDFPEEPLPNDGSWLHALERSLGLLAETRGYKQFYYYPPAGKFTTDKSHIFASYHKQPVQLFHEIANFDIVSFDIFDTVLRREYTEPEYAKFKLGQYLAAQGIVANPYEFIQMRNDAELALRKARNFQGDVCITDVYQELETTLQCSNKLAQQYLEMEFQFDLDMSKAKDEMVNIVHQLADLGREIWFITDIYYTKKQIEVMLRKIGISAPYRLFVSSDLGMRKDAGTMWTFIKAELTALNRSHLHVGDNVRSDAQICGDFGLANMHVLHPVDKWQACGFPPVLTGDKKLDENNTLKWGKLVANQGRYPFFGE
ncbi:MAG: FMN phosphatase YigB (HAD superfamily) [Paraglaciecola sp.]|jgi:FMN phosphatase YigB (HAD superfamily)